MIAILLVAILPLWEMRVVDRVSKNYGLTRTEKALLVAIRRAENGLRYFYGVIDERCIGYEAQCRWTANTIRLRYDGNLKKFSERWTGRKNPTEWIRNVKYFMRKQRTR